MERKYKIRFGNYRFPYYLGYDITDKYLKWIDQTLKPDIYFIVCDKNIKKLFAQNLAKVFLNYKPCYIIDFPPQESSKSIKTIKEIIDRMIARGATRSSVVVSLGGGTVANVAGLAAALIFRGVRLIHIPTTLLAMTDAVLSLKQGLNSKDGKNLIGTYFKPEIVLADLHYLKSLPKKEISSAFAEIIKNVLAINPNFLPSITKTLNATCNYQQDEYINLIEFCIKAKMKVMLNDPYEKGQARVLEYGHTIGHALEFVSKGTLSHGQSVAIGMVQAAKIAQKMGLLKKEIVNLHIDLLERAGCPTQVPASFSSELIVSALQFDNKRGYIPKTEGAVDMILLEDLGEPHLENNQLLNPVPLNLVKKIINQNE